MSIDYGKLETGEQILAAVESLKAEFKPEPFEKIIKTAVDGLKKELEVLNNSKATGNSTKTKKELTSGVKTALKALNDSLKVISKVSSAENADFSSSNAKKTIKAAEAFLAGPNMAKNPMLSVKIYGFVNFSLKERLSQSKVSTSKVQTPGKRVENLPKIVAELRKMLEISGNGARSFNKSDLLSTLQLHHTGKEERQLGLPEDSKLPVVVDGKKLEKAVSGWVSVIQNSVRENDPEISKYIKAEGRNFVLV